ncbi:MAG: hypothetical protein HY908_18590 [Myxococcales bacterium]|nr:hypothetical protein [Myxococcales bacterium]
MKRLPKHSLRAAALAGIALGSLLALGLSASTAHAAPGDEERAAELFAEGNVAFDADRFDEAYAKYTAAYALLPSTEIGGNLGLTELRLGKFCDAGEHLRTALEHASLALEAAKRERMKASLAEAESKSARLAITVNVPGAEVRVGEAVVGHAPLARAVCVAPGHSVVSARPRGYLPGRVEVEALAGESRSVELTLSPEATDESIGYAPGAVVLGLGAAGMAIGAGLLAAAGGNASDAADTLTELRAESGALYPCSGGSAPYADRCAQVLSAQQDHDTLLGAGRGLLIGGALGAAAGVVLLIVGRPVEGTAAVSVEPVLGPSVNGVRLAGAF